MDIRMDLVKLPEAIKPAMALVQKVFMEFEAPDYAQEGIDAFLDYINPAEIEKRMKNNGITVWSASVDCQLVGVVAMRPPCQVSLLFVDKQWHRKGIARFMLSHALSQYRQENAPVTVHSSPYAVNVYRRMGFVETGPEETVSGIRFQPMIYFE